MPAALWTAAVAAARQHGLYLTRPDATRRLRRAEGTPGGAGRADPAATFVELTPPMATAGKSIGYVIEIEGRQGTRRNPTEGIAPHDVVALARMAWHTDRR